MTPMKLLNVIGDVDEGYVLSALESRDGQTRKKKRTSLSRSLLIAAMIALMLLLVGCAVAYVLNLSAKKIGDSSATIYFDEEGQRIQPTEISQDVISWYGYQNQPAQMAAKEWYAFLEEYDPDRSMFPAQISETISNSAHWLTYHCYTEDMADKLDGILDAYDLKLLGVSVPIQYWESKIFFEGTKLNGLCKENADAEITYRGGQVFPEGAFDLDLRITLTGNDALWTDEVDATVYYLERDYFYPLYSSILRNLYEEWVYTRPDGTDILIAASDAGAFFFTEREDAYITVRLVTNPDPIMFPNDPKPSPGAFEQMADLFDFTIQPQAVDMDALQQKLAESGKAWEAEQAEKGKSTVHFESYGEYLMDAYSTPAPSVYYGYYDLNEDGVTDLLLGYEDGTFFSAKTIYDGAVVDLHLSGAFRLCEGGIIEGHNAMGTTTSYAYYEMGEYDAQGMGRHNRLLESVDYDSEKNIYWYRKDGSDKPYQEVTEAFAKGILEKYNHINPEIYPLMEYPVDESGKTLGTHIHENWKTVTQAELYEIYADEIQRALDDKNVEYRYYCLRDINFDDVPELLLAERETYFVDAVTVVNGEPVWLWHWSYFHLCENGVIRITSRNVYEDRYHFFCYENGERKMVDYLVYSAEDGNWQRSHDGDYATDQILSEEEGKAILDSYVILSPEMIPLSQFPAES